jgi:uncharacterized protein (DUF433 family)
MAGRLTQGHGTRPQVSRVIVVGGVPAITHPIKAKDIYDGADPRSLPAYPLVEAAHYLGLNASTLGTWFRTGAIVPAQREHDPMSFWSLVEAFVLKGLREQHRLSLQRIKAAVAELRRQYPDVSYPLAQLDLAVLNRDLYADRDGLLVDASKGGQLGIRNVLELYLSRVERDASGAVRLYPFTRPTLADAPLLVAIDPTVSFGRPVIAGTSIPTAVLHERWKAGDSIHDLAEDYDRPVSEIEEALRYEAA